MLKTSLIIDDSRLARLTLKRLLEKHQIKVYEAEGVLDAEQWVTQNVEPDLVFMDVMMPEIDGFEGLVRMRNNPRTSSIPVVMYSGDISDQARNKARSYGANGYLPKPADSKTLETLLERLNVTFEEKNAERLAKEKAEQEARDREAQRQYEEAVNQRKAAEAAAQAKKLQKEKGATGSMPFTNQSVQAFGVAENNAEPELRHSVVRTAQEEAKIAQEVSFALAMEEKKVAELAEQAARKVLMEEASKLKTMPDELRHRLNSIEERMSVQMLKNGVENEVISDVERHGKDLQYQQRQISSVEYQSRIAIIIGIVAILACIAVAIRTLI